MGYVPVTNHIEMAWPPKQAPPAAYDFDVIGHPRSAFRFAVVLPFHPYTDGRQGGQVTICKEFAQGVVAMMYTLPAGGYDPRKHATLAECAAAEMNEEVCTGN